MMSSEVGIKVSVSRDECKSVGPSAPYDWG